MDDLVAANLSDVFLYETLNDQGETKVNHIVWNRRYSEDPAAWQPISPAEWDMVQPKSESLEKASRLVIQSYRQALDFYEWDAPPKGFVVDGSAGLGMEAGADGIKISFKNHMAPLLRAVESGDAERVARFQKYLAASMARELARIHQDGGLGDSLASELPGQVAQFIFNTKNNDLYFCELDMTLENVRDARDGVRELEPYDLAQYAALLLVADHVAGQNPSYKAQLESDSDANKLDSLGGLRAAITGEDRTRLKAAFLPWVLKTDGAALLEKAKAAEGKWGISPGILEG
jgi:hypothetical protein